MDQSLEYFVLDVFTSRRLAGNPLAVFFPPDPLDTDQMLTIAKEMNLSETTFVERRSAEVEASAGIRVRIFTTQEELPFAGHPTLGTSALIRHLAPETVIDNRLRLDLPVGPIGVEFRERDSDTDWPVSAVMTQHNPEFGEWLDRAEVAELVGLPASALHPELSPQIVSTGTAFAIVPLRSVADLGGLDVRQEKASSYLRARGARWFYALAPTGLTGVDEPAWRARMQFHGGEDPATGSAAGCAISYLVAHGAVQSGATIHLRQGVEMLRPSDLFLSAVRLDSQNGTCAGNAGEVRVGGSTILVAKGRLFLP